MGSETARLDVLTMGRVGADIYPLQAGVSLEDVTTFGKYLGGSATNVAVAAARLGRSAAVITRTGNDPFGRFVHHALKGYGVSDQFVTGVAWLPTPVTFCEIYVMAGPGERAWLACDDPAHGWIRGTWPGQEADPRLTSPGGLR